MANDASPLAALWFCLALTCFVLGMVWNMHRRRDHLSTAAPVLLTFFGIAMYVVPVAYSFLRTYIWMLLAS